MRGKVSVWLRPEGEHRNQCMCYSSEGKSFRIRGITALKGKASKQADAKEYHRVTQEIYWERRRPLLE